MGSYLNATTLLISLAAGIWGLAVAFTLKKIYSAPSVSDELSISIRNEIGFRMKGLYAASFAMIILILLFFPDFFHAERGVKTIALMLSSVLFILGIAEQILKRSLLNRYLPCD